MKPVYKEGPRDRQNLLVITRFREIEVLFIYFTIIGVKKIVRYIEDFVK